ncbi:tetratricopeptide repeat protein [Tenacibaculum sp. 190524A02b]|uniref:tetratricopeptide repeat-containing sensor histidine kinase n=1 Tax=Tenacibaculum vairaonense TaxID=3137860 RepID=UPI0031FA502D
MKEKIIFLILCFIFSLHLTSCKEIKNGNLSQETQIKKDSISYFLNQSKNKSLDRNSRLNFLKKAYLKIKNKQNSNTKAKEFSSLAYQYYENGDTIRFLKINKEAENYAHGIKDTFSIADVYWNYADYYNNNQVFQKSYSYYNKAYSLFSSINKNYESAKMLYAMSYIKGRYRNYTGSEILTVKAIEYFKLAKSYKHLYFAYNQLGLLQHDIKEYDKAIFYYEKALEFHNKLGRNTKKRKYIAIYNNIGNAYLKKQQYNTALFYYNKELNNTHLSKGEYARIIDNRAFCKLTMKDTLGIHKDFYTALSIRDSLKNKAGIAISKIRLADYYKYAKDTLKAIQYAKESNKLSKETKNGRDYLTSLQQLANLDTPNTKKYLDRYITFNDSLISAERRIQNKFARIEFETDEYIEETERLTQQRIWILVTSLGGLLILSLLYFLRMQKIQNEKLSIEAEQQKANEEVYILTLQQQAKLEEERIKERNRISEELHDGILGKLFGTRFGLGFLPLQGDVATLEKHKDLLDELQDIEKEIRDVSHKLSDNFNSSDINFSSIIKQLLEDKSVIGNFKYQISVSSDISWNAMNEITKANIYRIIQEALQNIIKHANAKNVTLDFYLQNENLVAKITDDGVGFDSKKGKKGIGIKNIKSRVEKLKGSLTIESKINVGTTLHINTPYIKKDGRK